VANMEDFSKVLDLFYKSLTPKITSWFRQIPERKPPIIPGRPARPANRFG
jgi:hypothetical protein